MRIHSICLQVLGCALFVTSFLYLARSQRHEASNLGQRDWPVWGGAPDNQHYSPLAQINRDNVKQLQVAWTFDSGEKGGLQTSPLIVDGKLFGITPTQKIFAVNAATGERLWMFDSGIQGLQPDRGLAYWTSGN